MKMDFNLELFTSKRFGILLLAFLLLVGVQFVPQTADNAELSQAILWLTGILIGGYSVQDALIAAKGNSKYVQALFVAGEELVVRTDNTADDEILELLKRSFMSRGVPITEDVKVTEDFAEDVEQM